MTFLNRPAARWAAVAAWAAAIFILSAQTNLPSPPAPGFDKWEHAATYAVLAFLLARAWFPSLRRHRVAIRWGVVVLAAFGYGLSDEVHQAFVPNRSCDPWDAAADLTGAFLCAVIFGRWLRSHRVTRRLGLQ